MPLKHVKLADIKTLKESLGPFCYAVFGLFKGEITDDRQWFSLVMGDRELCFVEISEALPGLYPPPYSPQPGDYLLIFSPQKHVFHVVLPRYFIYETFQEALKIAPAKRFWVVDHVLSHLLDEIAFPAPWPNHFVLFQKISLIPADWTPVTIW